MGRERVPIETAEPVPAPEEAGRGRTGVAGLIAATSTWIFLVLVVIIAVFSLLDFDSFASVFNLRNIMIDASSLLIIAVGMTFVIITSGIDLSVGSVLVFSQVVASLLMRQMGAEGMDVILAGLVSSLLAGVAWGLLEVRCCSAGASTSEGRCQRNWSRRWASAGCSVRSPTWC
jgi:ribose transport system permease protein